MIIIKGRSRKSIALANYINNNIAKDKKIILFDSVNVPNLQFQIERKYGHYMFEHPFEELIENLNNENTKDLIEDFDVIVFECNISPEQLEKLNNFECSQEIIVTVQTDEETKVYDTKMGD